METELYKVRSLARCTQAAYDLFSTNLKNIIRKSWQPVTAIALLNAILVSLVYPWLLHTLTATHVGTALWEAGATMIILLIFSILSLTWFNATIICLLNGQSLATNFPRVLRLVLTMTGIGLVIGVIIALLSIFPMMGGATALTTQKIIISAAITLSTCIVIYACLLPTVYSSMKYYMELDQRLRDVFGKPYRTGWRFWGFLFVIILLTGIICGIIYVVLMMPGFVLQAASRYNESGVDLGDPSSLPAYFAVLLFLATFISAAIWCYVMVWAEMVVYYAYGHIEAQTAAKSQQPAVIPDSPTDNFPPIE
ncbi:MAG: hypothetical protein I3J02_05945 [Prevotella sp.]|nr:hypothetical protein [Prevotella sp.]